LVEAQEWRQVFNLEGPSGFRHNLMDKKTNPLKGLLEASKKLMDSLQKTRQESVHDPLLVMVFDEASSLLKKKGSEELQNGLYVALNRIISCLKEFRMWFFFLSTESQIGTLLPENNARRTGNYDEDPSARDSIGDTTPPLKRFPPFLALQLDVEDRRRMQDPKLRIAELRKSLFDFAQPKHMAIFGRPLWRVYDQPYKMYEVARLKLVGGKQGAAYSHSNEHHVFAALSFRLALDICLQNPRTISLARTAVNSFMRVAISMDQDTGVAYTITPSEPVLAKAAMEYLCEQGSWTASIRTFTKELLEKGLIEKGLKGELYSRLVMILAQDWVRLAKDLGPHDSPILVQELMPTFTVHDFLLALYAEDHHESIEKISPQILRARMNFTHFVTAGKNLSPKVIPALCHDLLRRSAAMQLAPSQPTYDKLVPFYCGEENEIFEPSKCGVILVQDKNKKNATTPDDVFKEDFTRIGPKTGSPSKRKTADSIRNGQYFVFNEMVNPILFLLFDMGIDRNPAATASVVQVSQSNSKMVPEVWAIHSRGHGKTVFGCLEFLDSTDASQIFFDSVVAGGSLHDELARRNEVFHELERSFRYLGFDSAQEEMIEEETIEEETIEEERIEEERIEEEMIEEERIEDRSLPLRTQTVSRPL